MSIYPVRLNEWYPVGNEHYMGDMMEVFKCDACGRVPNYKKAWGHHSLPWGHGEIWCSEKCLNSGKKHKMDKRQQRSWNRRYGNTYGQMARDRVNTDLDKIDQNTPWDHWKHNSL